MVKTLFEIDSVQFPRLLAELRAIGLTDEQYAHLSAEMSAGESDGEMREMIDELFERAEASWQRIKHRTITGVYASLKPEETP